MRYLTFALTKGRLAGKTMKMLESLGITCEEMKEKDSRKLIFTNEELKPLSLTSNVTLKFKDGNLFEGMKLCILDGNKLYKEITLGSDPVTINNMPNGVYSLELGTDTGYIQKPYLFVKDNGTVTISLNNYLKEATEAVDHLFQDNDHSKIKTNLMQKDIDQARKK